MKMTLDRAHFVLSLDFELAWGMRDLLGDGAQHEECQKTRDVVVPELLRLFEQYEMPATWCTVGQLFDEEIKSPVAEHFANMVPPTHAWLKKPWYDGVPSGNERDCSDYLGHSLLERIRATKPVQEIGSHGFSHAIFGDPGCSRACAQSEIEACIDRAQRSGDKLLSMAFPRNIAGHVEVLAEHGFICYRGKEQNWFYGPNVPDALGRAVYFACVLARRFAHPVLPQREESGLWNIPGSMILMPAHGFRKKIPMKWRVERAARGLQQAVREKAVFHLWFHPINLAIETEGLLSALESILKIASHYRERGEIEFSSMGQLASQCEAQFQRDQGNLAAAS